jgi:drug/metabolite transporter (DMT)-like permease
MLFGTTYVATGLALRSFTPITIAWWRAGIGAVALGVVILAVRRWGWPDRRDAVRFAILGVLNGPLFLVLMNVAVESAGATIAAFVSGMYAIVAALLAPFVLRERLGVRALFGFAVALIGTGLLARLEPDPQTIGGLIAGFGAAVCFALFLVLTRRWAGRRGMVGAPVALGTSLMTVAVLLPVIGSGASGRLVPPATDPVAVAALVWMGLGPSFLAQLLILDSVRRIPARLTSAFLLLNPPTAALGAALLLGERLDVVQLTGAGLVLVGMAAATLPGVVLRARPILQP